MTDKKKTTPRSLGRCRSLSGSGSALYSPYGCVLIWGGMCPARNPGFETLQRHVPGIAGSWNKCIDAMSLDINAGRRVSRPPPKNTEYRGGAIMQTRGITGRCIRVRHVVSFYHFLECFFQKGTGGGKSLWGGICRWNFFFNGETAGTASEAGLKFSGAPQARKFSGTMDRPQRR